MASSRPDILIVGASTRAAAFSAVRTGLRVAAADLFADWDLASVAETAVIENWPADIEGWAEQFAPSVPLVYTGGLENHPVLLDRIARSRQVAGVVGDSLRSVRNPEKLSELMSAHGVPIARLGGTELDRSRRWLVKPRNGGGGRGIRPLTTEATSASSDDYLQEFVDGTAGSAAYLASGDGEVELIGTCESLRGLHPDADPFAYFGSIVRRDWAPTMLEHAGRVLATIGLRGLFGIDFVRRESGECVVLELNPRYTASMELYELSQGRSLVAELLAIFDVEIGVGIRQRSHSSAVGPREAVIGKRIVYAPRDLTCHVTPLPTRQAIEACEYDLADIPAPNTSVPARAPICTVIAKAATVAACRMQLEQREQAVLAQCDIIQGE